jgi:type IV pilus assembly protein PilB
MSESRLRLGDTLVEAGVITKEQLGRALELQKERQLRLGTILLQEGFVAESQLVQALSLKLSIPWVSLWRIDIEDEMLDMVPANVAEEFFLIPIYIRTTAEGERALYVAMRE